MFTLKNYFVLKYPFFKFKVFLRGFPFILRDLATLVLQSANWQLYRKAWHFWGYTYSESFDIRALFVLSTVTSKIQNRPKNGIKSWIFSCDYFIQLLTWINSTTVHRWTLFNFWPWSSINDKCFSMLWLIQLRSYFTSKQIS